MKIEIDFKGSVIAVSCSKEHCFSKQTKKQIKLVAGCGVEGDAHYGRNIKHRSRVAVDPRRPNLRQVHLIQEELFTDLASRGFVIEPGQLGENITTRNIPLLKLPTGAQLIFPNSVVLELTGLRNPCQQIEVYRPGLLAAVLDEDGRGNKMRKCGVMAIVISGGLVKSGDPIHVKLPGEPHLPLVRV